ncbi:hypothetical protein E4T47_08202 [Aureobasidium subglaciale]|nr:hypothetical protein E4T47_08202 [Aureobasidium subglaciale]
MARHASTTSTLKARQERRSESRKDERSHPATPTQLPETTDVVIPSNLLAGIISGPYISNPNQLETVSASGTTYGFDVREIAQRLHGETSQVLARSTSVSIAALSRDAARGPTPDFRKTSLEPNFGSSLKSLSTLQRPDVPRYDLATVTEGQVFKTRKSAATNDYFGNYDLAVQGPRLHRRTSSGQSVPRKTRIDEPSPTHPSPLQRADSNPSYDANANQISLHPHRQSTAADSRKQSIVQRSASIVLETVENVKQAIRKSSIYDVYENAKKRGAELQRSAWAMRLFEYTSYTILVAFVYFVLIGLPLWKGAVYWLYWVFDHKFAVAGTWSVTIGIAFLYAYTPLLVFFEKDPPMPTDIANIDANRTPGVHNTALMIPCYKSAKIIGPTLKAALKIFPPSHIFVIANGNSPTPLDDTELVCRPYGVNHVWSPVGSKIVAQFVGCYAARGFQNVLLIDDDCALPPNFPIVSDRMTPMIKCIGYTIKSVGLGSSRGTLCQQAQDLEYKISGIQRALAGYVGSATFPHGAISLWDREFLIQTFYKHPGFSVSEDWFFGHVARQLGSRITMCTSVFIETETPNAVFVSSGGARGGFGEMTIFKQRFLRWNFFFVNGMYYNMAYILGSWKLGFWEIGAKLFVFQEVYETLLYLFTPFVLPISIIVRPDFFGYLFAGTFVLYFLNAVIFNELHLRLKNERVGSKCLYLYYMPYKIVLTLINVGSCYWSLYKYAQYFARRHPKIVEDEKAVDVVLRMEEQYTTLADQGRRMTITAVGAQTQGSVMEETSSGPVERKMTVTTLGPKLDMQPMSPVMEQSEQLAPAIRLQGERVSFSSVDRGSKNSAIRIGRMPRQDSDAVSPAHGPETVRPPLQSTTSKDADVRSVDRLSRRSGSVHSQSTRRSTSLARQANADFISPGFEELMDRLAMIEERLNPRTVAAVEVLIDEELVPRMPNIELPVVKDIEKDEMSDDDEGYELHDLEKMDTRKTEDSRSMA